MEVFILSVSVPWTLGRIAYFVLQDSVDEDTRQFEESLAQALVATPDASVAAADAKDSPSSAKGEKVNLVPIVWVIFGCTFVFMAFTASLLGVLGAIAGVNPSSWGMGVFLLGGLVPLFIVLVDVSSFTKSVVSARTFSSSKWRTEKSRKVLFGVAGSILVVAVPATLFISLQTRVGEESLGLWEYLAIVCVSAFGIAVFATVLWPAITAKPTMEDSVFVTQLPAAKFNLVTNFFAILSLCGAAAYCISSKWSVTDEWYSMALVCLLGLIVIVCLMFATCHRLPRAAKYPFQEGTPLASMRADVETYLTEKFSPPDAEDDPESGDSQQSDFGFAHTEDVTVCVATHTKEGGHHKPRTHLVATVRVRKTGGALAFQFSIVANFVQRWLEQKTLLLYIAWGDAWFLFAMLFVVSNMLVTADESFAQSEFNISSEQPSFDLLAYLWNQLFAADSWPRTLAQFFGADVVITDIIFGCMALSKLCAVRRYVWLQRYYAVLYPLRSHYFVLLLLPGLTCGC